MAFLVTDNASDLATLARLYDIGLGRPADGNGLAYWAETVEAGASLAAIAEGFAATRAFNSLFDADLTDADFVAALYQRATGSAPDAEGAAFWEQALADGLGRGEALAAFAATDAAQALYDVVGDTGLSIADYTPSAFRFGVASGDPAADSVVLWTHARPEGETGPVTVGWEVATDPEFMQIVASGEATASGDTDYTVKVIPEGLTPGTTYHYRFTANGETSAAGTTSTLPEGALDSLVLAFFSCSNYPAGFFNAYDAAVQDGFDVSVHLGDYIYEYGLGGYATGQAEALGRVPDPLDETVTLADYNARYAQYHSDADLQALRAAAPMIVMWDDHETANDAWAGGSENHDPATEGAWEDRVDAALEAFYNWNPIRVPDSGDLRDADRSFEFGDLVTLHMLETRYQARDETRADTPQAVLAKVTGYATDPTGQAFAADLLAFPELIPAGVDPTDPAALAALGADQSFVVNLAVTALVAEANDPDRSMVGDEQIAEFAARVDANDSAWQIIGSQTLMNRMTLPVPLLTDPGTLDAYAAILFKLSLGQPLTEAEQALLAAPRAPYNLDAWDGYEADREAVLEALDGRPALVIAGDTHNAWFGDVTTADGNLGAIEFAGPGVTSPGLEAVFPDLPPAQVAALFTALIDTLDFANTSDRGYVRLEITPDSATGEFVFVDTILSLDYETFVHTETAGIDLFG